MPPLTLQLDPATLARLGDEAARIRCPQCGGTCTREERAGTGAGRRLQVQCAYCDFGQLFEVTPTGAAITIDPEPMDRGKWSFDATLQAAPRVACLVKCGRLAVEGGFCEPCFRAWRIAGKPEPRDAWAQQHAEQLNADRAKSGAPRPRIPRPRNKPRPNNKEVAMPDDHSAYQSLSADEKRRWSYVKKCMPGMSIEQWIKDGKPKPTHYKKRANARPEPAPKAHAKLIQTAPEPPSTPARPATTKPASLPSPQALILGETMTVSDPLVDLATSIIGSAAKRGGRCRVVVFDLDISTQHS